MESLLKWALENTSEDAPRAPPTAERMKALDPELIDMILGKSDAVVMQEKLALARDESREEDERIQALDDFEMLIEQIDNANNIENLKMWEPLIELMRSSSRLQTNAISIGGTAVHNNDKAQRQFLKRDPMEFLLPLLTSEETSGATRAKVLYCLSGMLKHNASAVQRFDELGGWEILKHALQDPDIAVRRKAAWLINTLLLQDGAKADAAPPRSAGPRRHGVEGGEPASESTNGLVRNAVEKHQLIDTLMQPLPHGPNGDATDDPGHMETTELLLETFERNGGELGDATEAVRAFKEARSA